jgi:hypothetical protein
MTSEEIQAELEKLKRVQKLLVTGFVVTSSILIFLLV